MVCVLYVFCPDFALFSTRNLMPDGNRAACGIGIVKAALVYSVAIVRAGDTGVMGKLPAKKDSGLSVLGYAF